MLFTPEISNKIYSSVYKWLSAYTPGEPCYKSTLKGHQKEAWDPVIKILEQASLTPEDRELHSFVKAVSYSGPIYRIQNYFPKCHGHIVETPYYQSWSKSLQGIGNVTNYCNKILLIEGVTNNAIDVFGLLCFLKENGYLESTSPHEPPANLCRYENEEEVVCPVQFKNIVKIDIVDKKDILHSELKRIPLPQEKWERNSL